MPKKKIFFILPTLYAGGAERVISFVSQNLNKDRFITKLIVIGYKKDSKFSVENGDIIYLNKNRILKAILAICRILMHEKPDIVVSSISHMNALMGLISVAFPKIQFVGRVSAINKISSKINTKKTKSIFHKLTILSDYGITRLDYIICQSIDMKNDFLDCYKYDKKRIQIIHNPITQSSFEKYKNINEHKPTMFLTIGRLTEIKGHLRILNILSKLNFPFIYTVVGDGPLKNKILEKADFLGLTAQIKHISYSDNVNEIILNNDIFLQGSHSEGFPNALLESCVLGIPVIAFNAPGGTREIIENGVNGFLVNSEEEFLERLNGDKKWDPKIISDSVYKKFNKEKIISEYEQLFINILKQQRLEK
ncbi:glycosyltransferase [Gelidibacter mesophilus]|uniref:glycosyltransferase n=1 Tax=Gelidibacter mesophilus TaxID=169050 RepID=UPI00040EDC82|nr:glycosyltransferase [Gelidibacter mesophilus]